MLIGPVIVTQIVNAIDHQSMKRNQLCLRGRTMIALSSMWMLEDLRQSLLFRTQQRASKTAQQRAAGENNRSNSGRMTT
jgi:hypothetical protein